MKRDQEEDLLQSCYVQFHQIIRSFAIRYVTYLKQKSQPVSLIEQLEINLNKILNLNQSKEVILTKLLALELKNDYHQVIALTMLQDLAKWSKENYNQLLSNNQQKNLQEAIIQQSIRILNSQQQFHTIVPKQNDLLKQLLVMPYLILSPSIQNYRTLYRKLKDIKQFYPQIVKQNQKIIFLKTVEQSIEICIKLQATKTLQFIFNNLFAQLEVLDENHQFMTSRLKLIKKIVKNIWFFHDQIMYKSAFIIMKLSHKVLSLPHLFSSVLNLYQDLLPRLIKKCSPAALIIFNHLILNNIKKIIQENQSYYFCLQIFLNSLTEIFTSPFIQYFMKHYDANFMQQSICQTSLNILFEFVENRANQKKYYYEIFKKYLKKATDNIRNFLNKIQPTIVQPSQKLIKFYQVKKKEYLQIVQDMNQKPKKIFKKLESISNKEIKQEIIKKYVRIAKKSIHLENKKMIDVFAANNTISQDLFAQYINLLFHSLSNDVNLQEFLRYFSSNFFLNGQSQQILRVLDKITVLFYNHQPYQHKILKNSDSTYTFANAIILLNTDLHNPQNQQKMSLESFYKICKKINNGQDLPNQILNSTYSSIKKNKINTFRNKSSMLGISASNFVLICNKQQENVLQFYDSQMKMLQDNNFYNFWIYDLLVGIIDERETMKLEQLIERFVYDDNSYQCQVVQLIRKLTKKKPHIPLHALQKILQHANFKHAKTSQKTISYLWLCTNIVQNFSNYLPTNVICQILILTWRIRSQIKDDMYLRQKAQIKRIKKVIKDYQKRQSKKSIMDMFSSFLTYKQDISEDQEIEQFNMSQTNIKKMNHKILTQKILEVLLKSNSWNLKSKVNHRAKAIQFFIGYLRNDQQKIFEQFLSLLYLIFHLLYRFDIKSKVEYVADSDSPTQPDNKRKMYSPGKKSLHYSNSSSINLSSQADQNNQRQPFEFQQTIQDLFYQLLGLKQSSITKRIQNLRKKDNKKYQILQSYSHFWVLKILINKIDHDKIVESALVNQNNNRSNNNQLYLLHKSMQYIQKTNKQIYLDLVYEFEQKTKEIFSVSFTNNKSSKNENLLKSNQRNGSRQKISENVSGNLQQQKRQSKQNVLNQQKMNREGSVQEQKKIEQQVNKSAQKIQQQHAQVNDQLKNKIQQSSKIKNQQQKHEVVPQISQSKQTTLPQTTASQSTTKQQKSQQSKVYQNIQPSQQQQNLNSQNVQTNLPYQPSPQLTSLLDKQQQQQDTSSQLIIQGFIYKYKKIIIQFFVNCQRLIGQQQMKKNKEWKWLINIEGMIQQVIQAYEERERDQQQENNMVMVRENANNDGKIKSQQLNKKELSINSNITSDKNLQQQINQLNQQQNKQQQPNSNINRLDDKGQSNDSNISSNIMQNKIQVQAVQNNYQNVITSSKHEQNITQLSQLSQQLHLKKIQQNSQKQQKQQVSSKIKQQQSIQQKKSIQQKIQKQLNNQNNQNNKHYYPQSIKNFIKQQNNERQHLLNQQKQQKENNSPPQQQLIQNQNKNQIAVQNQLINQKQTIQQNNQNNTIQHPNHRKQQNHQTNTNQQQKQKQLPKLNNNNKQNSSPPLSQQKLSLLQMMKQQQQQLKKLQQMYAQYGENSPEILKMPFFMI